MATDTLKSEAGAPARSGAAGRPVAALVISNLEFGGAERQVVELANHLPSQGFEVHVVSLEAHVPLAAHLDETRAKLHVVAKRHKYDAGLVLRLAALLREIGADVVHAFLFDAEIAGRLAARIARVPVVIGSERNSDYTIPALKRALYRATAFAMDACIANSRAGAEFNARVLRQPGSKYRVVYNGVDTARFKPRDGREIRRELGIGEEEFCVGVFGSFKPQKNHLLFFSVAGKLVEQCAGVRFLVVGDSLDGGRRDSASYKQRVVDLIGELGLEQRCLFAGNRGDVERLYGACDVTVLASLHEGTPNVALESMASEVPVVATDVSDNRHVVRDGQTGFVVAPGDAEAIAARVLELYADPERRAEMGREARRWAEERFSLERLAAETAAVYLELLEAKGRRAAA